MAHMSGRRLALLLIPLLSTFGTHSGDTTVIDSIQQGLPASSSQKYAHLFATLMGIKADLIEQLRYNLFTFGFGVRKCLGQHDAELLIKSFMFEMLQQYDLSLTSSGMDLDGPQSNWVPVANLAVRLQRRDSL